MGGGFSAIVPVLAVDVMLRLCAPLCSLPFSADISREAVDDKIGGGGGCMTWLPGEVEKKFCNGFLSSGAAVGDGRLDVFH